MRRFFITAILMLFMVSRIALGQCTQTFTPSNVGTSPYPGSNVNTAVKNGNGSTVLCFASGTYGEIDLYNAHPSGVVTLTPAAGATVTGISWNLNGVSNAKFTGFSGSSSTGEFDIIQAGQGNSSNIEYSNNRVVGGGGILVRGNTNTNANINIHDNTVTGFNPSFEIGALTSDSNSGCPNGVVFRNNVVNGTAGDGMRINGNACGTQFVRNEITNFVPSTKCQASQMHCDAFQDAGGGRNTVLDGNYIHHVINCWQATDGTTNLTIINNVCTDLINASYSGQLSPVGLTFRHNTIITPGIATHIGNDSSGTSASNIINSDNAFNGGEFLVNNGQTVNGTFSQDYNVCDSNCTGSHSLTGSPTFIGGSSPSTYVGFALASTSIGNSAASDGTDMGIAVTAASGTLSPPSNLAALVQ